MKHLTKLNTFQSKATERKGAKLGTTFWELGMAVRMVRSAATAFLYRDRACSRAPPPPAAAVVASAWWLEFSEVASALGEEEAEGEVDHKTGLQSSSFMEERIWKAFSMVSSKYSCPSIANSCVVLDPDIVPFTDCSSSILSAKTSLRFRNRKTLTFYLRIENTAKEASDRTKHTQAHSSQQRTQRDSNLLRLKLGRFQVCLLSRSDISNFFKFYSYTIFFILIFSFSLKSYEDKIYIYIYICVYIYCKLGGKLAENLCGNSHTQ